MTAPLMPKATAVWLVENTTLTFRQIAKYCELHELEIQAIADGDVAYNIIGISPVANGQLSLEEIKRCENDKTADLVPNVMERNVKEFNAKNKKVLSPSQRSDKPAAILWLVRNCPDLTDPQICKLIGTTKPTIQAIRTGTRPDMADLRAKNPVAVGLCSEKDLDLAIKVAKAKLEKPAKPVKTKKASKKKAARKTARKAGISKTAKKSAAKKKTSKHLNKETKKMETKKTTAKKPAAKKAAPAKKPAVKKVAAKKPVAKKAAPAKKPAAKKVAAKKPVAKKVAAKKPAAKKVAAKKATPAKKPAAKKVAAKKPAAKKTVAKKPAAKKTAAEKPAPAKKEIHSAWVAPLKK